MKKEPRASPRKGKRLHMRWLWVFSLPGEETQSHWHRLQMSMRERPCAGCGETIAAGEDYCRVEHLDDAGPSLIIEAYCLGCVKFDAQRYPSAEERMVLCQQAHEEEA